MLFNSFSFVALFLPLVWICYCISLYFERKKITILILVLFSVVFYLAYSKMLFVLLLSSVAINYLCGNIIYLLENSSSKKVALTVGIALNLAILFNFKYMVDISQLNSGFATNVAIPLGISFYTFQQISYLIDLFKKKLAAPDFMSYLLYVIFFPQLIAGPLVRAAPFFSQLNAQKFLTVDWQGVAKGLSLFALGLSKKVLIADQLAVHTSPLFETLKNEPLHPFSLFTLAIAFGAQLYFDYSGYSDMAVGLGRFFNIDLPVNFYSAPKATNIAAFWQRWHITISHFCRDYFYYPLVKKYNFFGSRYIFASLTILLLGIWHGAGFNFLIYAIIHIIFFSTFMIFRRIWPINQRRRYEALQKVLGRALTTFCVSGAALLFYLPEPKHILNLANSFSLFSVSTQAGLDAVLFNSNLEFWYLILLAYFIGHTMPNSIEIVLENKAIKFAGQKIFWNANWLWGFVTIIAFILCAFHFSDSREFIYYAF